MILDPLRRPARGIFNILILKFDKFNIKYQKNQNDN